MTSTNKHSRPKKNSPTNTEEPSTWDSEVWEEFRKKLLTNRNRDNQPYYRNVRSFTECEHDIPPALRNALCHHPNKSTAITVVVKGQQYQRPLHRVRFMLKAQRETGKIPKAHEQASHLCPDSINIGGKGGNHCCNPNHMVQENDAQNKSRQNCPGWIWLHEFEGQAGNRWYPACQHEPPCLVYTKKTQVPFHVRQQKDAK